MTAWEKSLTVATPVLSYNTSTRNFYACLYLKVRMMI